MTSKAHTHVNANGVRKVHDYWPRLPLERARDAAVQTESHGCHVALVRSQVCKKRTTLTPHVKYFDVLNGDEWSRDSSVAIVTRLRAERMRNRDSIPGRRKIVFSLLRSPRTRPGAHTGPEVPVPGLVPTQAPKSQYQARCPHSPLLNEYRTLSLGVKWPRRVGDHSPATSAAVKKQSTYTSTPPHAFMTYTGTTLLLALPRGHESLLVCDTVCFGTSELTLRRAEVDTLLLIYRLHMTSMSMALK